MYIDRAQIRVEAGNGGAGSRSFRREKYVPKGGPDGGDGGNGGSIIIRATGSELTLIALKYKTQWKAANGGNGRGQKLHGASGDGRGFAVSGGVAVGAAVGLGVGVGVVISVGTGVTRSSSAGSSGISSVSVTAGSSSGSSAGSGVSVSSAIGRLPVGAPEPSPLSDRDRTEMITVSPVSTHSSPFRQA